MSDQSEAKIWFNKTSSVKWRGPDVGVIRTEKSLEREFRRLFGRRFETCIWQGGAFRELREGATSAGGTCRFRRGDYLLTFGLDWEQTFHRTQGSLRREVGLEILNCCYDLIPILMPQYCVADTRTFFASYFINIAEGASSILCISESSKRDLLSFLDSVGARIPQTDVFRLGDNIACATPEFSPRVKSLLDRPFALYVSTVERRKNHSILYQAMRLIAQRNDQAPLPRMLFVGMRGWGVDDLLLDIKLDPLTRGLIEHLERVSDAELAALYKHATCVVFPSHYEGWGLPVAEALSFGKAVLASNSSSLPEIGGDLVTYLDPLDARHWAAELSRVFRDAEYRETLEGRVRQSYRPWTWADAANNILDKLPNLALYARQ